ncbi:hypothetical protein ABFS82_07G005800 [Erythranthe guttata]|uniref:4Fe-4S ferredoxin-type domain-containing protein n=1 Tax=Erythranthe guttata TaxID=4155 RepID=A0A022QNY8_ERYGU|nr:PREDICTED: uncharacterized protein LOC105966594 [Erythranthe guttata]EYU29661.1 hypothetical protein MIMGU_mgv1a007400mg [Erythranthe guttata]|eukprot:XP_012846621.1 PREDICTED: uncharacterized protein LOC105966594 [Erythranthe guttata]
MNMSLGFSCSASLSPQLPSQLLARNSNNGGLEKVKNLITKTGIPSHITSPLESLQKGNWVKLICGASFEDVVDIRNLSLVYTLAGVDCIDCAAESSVINAVHDGIEAARSIIPVRRPWVMISINDSEDLHFRKAEFDPDDCPIDCSRPCENVCPADAISYLGKDGLSKGGVLAERCYGCGRCLPICPYDKIRAITYIRDVAATAKLLKQDGIDAIEIHTSGREADSFRELWNGLEGSIDKLRLVAISLPDLGELTIPAMNSMYATMNVNLHCLNLWQLDGRPMSGDIGRGATREAIKFARDLVSIKDKPRGFLQLAGGTNAHTVEGLKRERLFQTAATSSEKSLDSSHAMISGVAYGGYARKIVGRVLRSLQSEQGYAHLEDYPDHLLKALIESIALVGTVKSYNNNGS